MPVIAIINRKGGSGKSTLAAHIAAWCARNGSAVMLGDVDRQQSARSWLKRRAPDLPAIAPWAVDHKNMLRVPTGITHVVLDTPGGMHGFELARVVMFADLIIMPVCHSMFDRESATQCHAELMAMPRVASGRCRLATVGMRIDGRTNAAESLKAWSTALGVPFLGALRETQLYVRSLERGLTIFDLPERSAATDLQQWEPILDWLRPVFYAPVAANDSQPASSRAPPVEPLPHASRVLAAARQVALRQPVLPTPKLGSSLPSSLMPAQESLIHGARMSAQSSAPASAQPARLAESFRDTRQLNRPEGEQIPRFLRRGT